MEPGKTRMGVRDKWDAANQLAVLIEVNHRHEVPLALLAWARMADCLADVVKFEEAMQISSLARKMLIARGIPVAA